MYARYLAEMLGIMGDYGQPKMTSSNGYKNIEVANNNTLTCERLTNFSIIAHPITKREDGKSLFNFFRFLKVSLYGFAVESSISEFRNTYLRCKYLIGRCLGNMFVHSTTMTKVFNPGIGIKNKSFHNNSLIVKVEFTICRATIIAMLHHLIILFAFSIRPTACQTKETSFALFSSKFGSRFFWHNQLICQPLTITLRE